MFFIFLLCMNLLSIGKYLCYQDTEGGRSMLSGKRRRGRRDFGQSRGKRSGLSKIKQLFSLPAAAWDYAVGKWHGMEASHEMLAEAEPLQIAEDAASELMAAWLKLEKQP